MTSKRRDFADIALLVLTALAIVGIWVIFNLEVARDFVSNVSYLGDF